LSESAGWCELEVQDEGSGIPQEAQSRIFERFYRVEESRSRVSGEGAGLGLAIARVIARSHEGSMKPAESNSHGSTFRVRLPAAGKLITPTRSGHAVLADKRLNF
jgi:two-component system sensor histidine kinase SenX3